jgi:hypothetical protein
MMVPTRQPNRASARPGQARPGLARLARARPGPGPGQASQARARARPGPGSETHPTWAADSAIRRIRARARSGVTARPGPGSGQARPGQDTHHGRQTEHPQQGQVRSGSGDNSAIDATEHPQRSGQGQGQVRSGSGSGYIPPWSEARITVRARVRSGTGRLVPRQPRHQEHPVRAAERQAEPICRAAHSAAYGQRHRPAQQCIAHKSAQPQRIAA